MTLYLGPVEDRQSEHGQQALEEVWKGWSKSKVLPASASKTLAAGHFLPVTKAADTALPWVGLGLKPNDKHLLLPST